MGLFTSANMRETLFFLALTCSLVGLQGVFSVVLAMGSPFLLSLGFSKPAMALVWLAGPIFGILVQPYLGLCSDRSRISWGKRRPYILGGALGIVAGLLALAWVRDIVEMVAWILLVPQDSHELQTALLVAGAMSLWTLIFSVQPIQFGLRALIVDRCTTEQMNEANAWAGRMIGIGSMLGYLMQYIHFEPDSQSVDDVQFKIICSVVSAVLIILVLVTCACIGEQDPNLEKQIDEISNPLTKIIELWKCVLNLSPDVMAICQVQFCSWFGWYSFMFYATTYVGEIYIKQIFGTGEDKTNKSLTFQESALHYGALAFLIYSVINMATTIVAPWLVEKRAQHLSARVASSPSGSGAVHANAVLRGLRAGWIFSEALFGLCLLSTFFISSVAGAMVMVSVIGVSAALSQQIVPFALLSIKLSRYQEKLQVENDSMDQPQKAPAYETRGGVVMGLHNVAISAPQLLASVVSSIIFGIIGDQRSQDVDSAQMGVSSNGARSTAWVLRTGGFTALLAAFMLTRISFKKDEMQGDLPSYDEATVEELYRRSGLTDDEEEMKGLVKPPTSPSLDGMQL